MFTLLLILHIFICLALVFIILLQSGRGAELGAAFGSMGQATTARSPMTGIGKVTAGFAAFFMVTSFGLAYLSSENASDSVLERVGVPGASAPSAPPPVSLPATPPASGQAAPANAESATPVPPTVEQKDAPPMPPTPPAVPADQPPAAPTSEPAKP